MFEIVSIEWLCDINEKRKILDEPVYIAYKANRRGFLTRNTKKFPVFKYVALNSFLLGFSSSAYIIPKR